MTSRFYLIGLLCLICVWQTPAFAAPRTVYQGTLQGAGEVVMELDNQPGSDGTRSGRYFYDRFGVDIPLHGPLDNMVEPQARSALPDSERDGSSNQADFDVPAAA
jgi:hypothetical protein